VNIGVLAVAIALASATVGAGLGLFGVLSIIRLGSAEPDHEEIAYHFAALAFGILLGFEVEPAWLAPTLMGAMTQSSATGRSTSILRNNSRIWLLREADPGASRYELARTWIQACVRSRARSEITGE